MWKTTTWTKKWGRQPPEQRDGEDNNLNTAMEKTQTMNSTELPMSILIRAISCDFIFPLDDVSARHAAACLSVIVVMIVIVVTTTIITPGRPAPYTKASR